MPHQQVGRGELRDGKYRPARLPSIIWSATQYSRMTSRKSWSCTTTSACSRRSPNHCGDFRLGADGRDRAGISDGCLELHGTARRRQKRIDRARRIRPGRRFSRAARCPRLRLVPGHISTTNPTTTQIDAEHYSSDGMACTRFVSLMGSFRIGVSSAAGASHDIRTSVLASGWCRCP